MYIDINYYKVYNNDGKFMYILIYLYYHNTYKRGRTHTRTFKCIYISINICDMNLVETEDLILISKLTMFA